MNAVDRKIKIHTKNGSYSEGAANRSILTVTWDSNNTKTAVAIGINPSKANDNRSDKTLTTLGRFLAANGYKELKMFNIFESYSTDQSGINYKTATDFVTYKSEFENADAIFIVWGVAKSYKSEKEKIIEILKEYGDKIYCLKKDNRYPLHPSRMSYECEISKYSFD